MVFTIPSWRKASKVKKHYSTEYANQVLLNYADKQKFNEENNSFNVPNDFLGKSLYKTLDFLFKRKKIKLYKAFAKYEYRMYYIDYQTKKHATCYCNFQKIFLKEKRIFT